MRHKTFLLFLLAVSVGKTFGFLGWHWQFPVFGPSLVCTCWEGSILERGSAARGQQQWSFLVSGLWLSCGTGVSTGQWVFDSPTFNFWQRYSFTRQATIRCYSGCHLWKHSLELICPHLKFCKHSILCIKFFSLGEQTRVVSIICKPLTDKHILNVSDMRLIQSNFYFYKKQIYSL